MTCRILALGARVFMYSTVMSDLEPSHYGTRTRS